MVNYRQHTCGQPQQAYHKVRCTGQKAAKYNTGTYMAHAQTVCMVLTLPGMSSLWMRSLITHSLVNPCYKIVTDKTALDLLDWKCSQRWLDLVSNCSPTPMLVSYRIAIIKRHES